MDLDQIETNVSFLGLLTELVALKACGLCDNGKVVDVTVRGQTELGHLQRAKSQAVVVIHQLKNPLPCRSCATAHYFWLSG